jgi:hypothetical protein
MSSFFSDIDPFSPGGSVPEKVRMSKVIIENDIGFFQGFLATESEKSRVTGASSDQGHMSLPRL